MPQGIQFTTDRSITAHAACAIVMQDRSIQWATEAATAEAAKPPPPPPPIDYCSKLPLLPNPRMGLWIAVSRIVHGPVDCQRTVAHGPVQATLTMFYGIVRPDPYCEARPTARPDPHRT